MFVVGRNGSGKSALIHRFVSENSTAQLKWIAAHRQTWLRDGNLSITAGARKEFETNNAYWVKEPTARWTDEDANTRQMAVLFDLVAKEEGRASSIAQLVDNGQLNEAKAKSAESPSPFAALNDLLASATLSTTLAKSNDGEIQVQCSTSSATYGFAQMSDGERNAAMIGAAVLTAEPGTILLIDEPERHLHRSIIEPFFSALFAKRGDCTFIVATHELALPASNPEGGVLMVRSCDWESDHAVSWDIDFVEPDSGIPEELRFALLGSRRKILFVEGEPTGGNLDLPLYDAIFPQISVVACGSSQDVQRAVDGISGSQELHHIQAFGLVDGDGHPEENVEALAKRGIFALEVYSVESLYYCLESIEVVAQRQAEFLGRDPSQMKDGAVAAAFAVLEKDELSNQMAARRCVQLVDNKVKSQIPTRKQMEDGSFPPVSVDVEPLFKQEVERFNLLLEAKEFDKLVARYPLRHSRVFSVISESLAFKHKSNYEQALVTRVRSDTSLAVKLRQRIKPLAEAIGS